jgi:hypothetical protein
MRPEHRTLQSFLRQTGSNSVLEYLGLDMDPDPQSVASAIQRRRRWAQARLSNPRYEAEARSVLTHHALMAQVVSESGDDGEQVDQLRAFWRGLTLAGLPRPERVQRMHGEAARIGVSAERLEALLVVGSVTVTECVTQDPSPPPQPAPAPVPSPRRSARRATRDAMALARRLTEIVNEGVLHADALEDVLESAQERGLRPAETLAELDASVRRARREQRRLARACKQPSRDQVQAALQEVCDSLRELAIHGFLDDRSLRVVERQARRNGLQREQVEELLCDAQATARHMQSNARIPAAVLSVPATAAVADIDQAWSSARAEGTESGGPWEQAHRVMPLDMAWAVLRRVRAQDAAPTEIIAAPELELRQAAYAV